MMHPAFVLFSAFILETCVSPMIYYRCPLSLVFPPRFFCNRCPTEFSSARSPCATPITRHLTEGIMCMDPCPSQPIALCHMSHMSVKRNSPHMSRYRQDCSTANCQHHLFISLKSSTCPSRPITRTIISYLAETLTPGLSSPPFACPTYSDSLVKTEARP